MVSCRTCLIFNVRVNHIFAKSDILISHPVYTNAILWFPIIKMDFSWLMTEKSVHLQRNNIWNKKMTYLSIWNLNVLCQIYHHDWEDCKICFFLRPIIHCNGRLRDIYFRYPIIWMLIIVCLEKIRIYSQTRMSTLVN